MLKAMRNSFQHLKWILVFIVALFVLLVFVDWGGGGAQQAATGGYAARVNGDTISERDYSRALFYTEKRYEDMYGQPINDQMRQMLGINRMVIQGLIDQKLLLQEADRLHMVATPEEIRRKIFEIPALNPNGKFVGSDLYHRYITGSLGYPSVSEFENEIGREVTLGKMDNVLESSITVPLQRAETEYRKSTENAKVRMLLFPADRLAYSVAVTPQEVDQSYKVNTAKYAHGDQRHVKYLLADLNQIRSRLTASDADLRGQYEKSKEAFKGKEAVHAQHILLKIEPNAAPAVDAAVKLKAEGLVAQLRAGADFGALAKANSADPGSAVKGGDVGFFERGQMVPEFEQKAFALKIGEISEPVRTSYGYHILKVLERRAEGYKPFEEVRGQLQSQLLEDQAKNQARELVAGLRTRIQQVKPKNDEQIRAMTGPTVSYNDAQWFAKNDPITGFGKLPALSDWAFSAKDGDFGPIVDTPRGPVVPWLVGSRGAGTSDLAEIRPRVEADAKMEKARQMAIATLQQNAGTSLDEIGKKVGVTPEETVINRSGFVQRISGNINPVVDAALTGRVGEIKGPFAVNEGAVLVQITEQKKFDPQDFAKNKDSYSDSLRSAEARKLRASLLERLKKRSKIDVNEKLTQSAAATPAA